MIKHFDAWSQKKKEVERTESRLLFKEGQIWWCFVGENVGTEICGKSEYFTRPVLILKALEFNQFIGVPLTTKTRSESWYCRFEINGRQQSAALHQTRMFNVKRLQRLIAHASDPVFMKIKKAYIGLLLQ